MAGVYIFGIIESKFDYQLEFSFIILFEVDKNVQISLYNLVLSLCLAICLQIKGDKELLFDAKKIIKQQQNLEVNNKFLLITIKSNKP